MKRRILIFGITGMLGHILFKRFSKRADQYVVYGTARMGTMAARWFDPALIPRIVTGIDIHDFDSVIRVMDRIRPDVVINCISIIKQSALMDEPVGVIRVNALFPHRLGVLCRMTGVRLIHFSTDCVFSGHKGNYSEDDIPDPTDFYGRSKLLGEIKGTDALTMRTSLVGRELFTRHGLFEWFISQKGKRAQGYAGAIYSGFTTDSMADLIHFIIDQHPDLSGVWHVSSDPINKYELLSMLNRGLRLGITLEKDENFACDRSLDSSRFRKKTGFVPPTWEHMMERFVKASAKK